MKTYRTFLEIAHSCYLVQICNKSSLIFTRIFVILYLVPLRRSDYVQENYDFFGSLEK